MDVSSLLRQVGISDSEGARFAAATAWSHFKGTITEEQARGKLAKRAEQIQGKLLEFVTVAGQVHLFLFRQMRAEQ